MKNIIVILLILFGTYGYGQEAFNLDFEKTENGKPINWENFGNGSHKLSLDTVFVYSGKKSAVIEYEGKTTNFRAWAYTIPAKYEGDKIKLTGYIKTEDVEEGWAGLWLRIDPHVGFDNMQNRGIIGTTEWKRYQIELDLNPDRAEKIVFGGILAGKGKMWLDSLNLTIDGDRIEKAKLKELLLAEKDTVYNEGSGINIPELNLQLTENLEFLGKVWGFLKYHHPSIGTGNYNWDYELFRMLPDYLKIEDPLQRDTFLSSWITGYGEVPTCESCKDPGADAFLKPDHGWLTNGQLSDPLKQQLLHILKNRHQGKHYYVSMAPNVGNPEFKHESSYANMPYPDDGFRLLALYKYWNMIHYFFPYKHLISGGWDGKLKDNISIFIKAKGELSFELAALRLIGAIQDTHANLWGGKNAMEAKRGTFYPPFHLGFIENQLTVLDYYNQEHENATGLKVGTVITKVRDRGIKDIIDENRQDYPASNEPTRLRDLSANLLRSNDPEIAISYLDANNKEVEMELQLYPKDSLSYYGWYRPSNELSYKLLDGNIGYITLKTIKQNEIETIKETFKDTEGIIIDIRNYPSTFVPFALGSYFAMDNTPFVKFTGGQVDSPGTFTFTPTINIKNNEEPYTKKLVVIVNELSQSQAEYTAMAFRAGVNTTVIGSTTAGADGNVSTIMLPGGLRTMISGIGVYYPDGTETQQVGIIPDIEVKPTLKGIREGRDELLEKAIEIIKE